MVDLEKIIYWIGIVNYHEIFNLIKIITYIKQIEMCQQCSFLVTFLYKYSGCLLYQFVKCFLQKICLSSHHCKANLRNANHSMHGRLLGLA